MGGEGVLSLAREFTLAGSASTLSGLWAIDDCSTSEIMEYYYQNLYENQSKDEALSPAKLTFLEKADKELAHFYYWAAFLQFGNVEALKDDGFSMWLIGLIPVFLIFIFWKKSKTKTT